MAKTYTNNACAWVKKDKNGKPYISFKAERDIKSGENINLFKNDKGDNPARPDYRSFEVTDDAEPESELTDSEMDEIPV